MGPGLHVRSLSGDERGTILVFWAVALAVLLGLVALSFDIGRIAVTQTELQSFADNVALAAAGELDGKDDSLVRAESAAAAMISDRQTYGSGDSLLSGATDYSIVFLASLPASDATAATDFTTDPQDAAYVQVTANAQTVQLTFAAAFAALTGSDPINNVVSARAVAGYTAYACDITPMMFCLPSGWTGDAHRGDMVQLRAGGGGGSAWAPGEFGFLDPDLSDDTGPCSSLHGGSRDLCYLAAVGPITKCYSQRGVDIEPGEKQGNYAAAINTRFDIYQATMSGSDKKNPLFAPARNVIKGIQTTASNCKMDPSTNTIGQPEDACFATGTCNDVNGGYGPRFGDGNWNRTAYFATNYYPFNGTVPTDIQTWLTNNAVDPSNPTRFEVYQAESARTGRILTGDADGDGHDGNPIAEHGRPVCNTENNPEITVYRRTIVAAGVDCTGLSGAEEDVPIEEFVMFFLTEPTRTVGSGSSGTIFDIWAEVVGTVGGGDGGNTADALFHDVVQLYR